MFFPIEAGVVLASYRFPLHLYHVLILARAWFKVVPDVAQLGKRAEDGSPDFVDIVGKTIRALDELRLGLVDYLKLDFADYSVVEFDIDKNVVCTLLQPVFYADYLHLLRGSAAQMLDLLKNLNYFLLLRGHLASHEVSNLERYQMGRRRPISPAFIYLFFMKFFGYFKKSVNKPVEIQSYVRIKVFNCLFCEFA